MDRRQFIKSAVAVAVAAAIGPVLYGNGIHDDTLALQEILDRGGNVHIPKGEYVVSDTLVIRGSNRVIDFGGCTLKWRGYSDGPAVRFEAFAMRNALYMNAIS